MAACPAGMTARFTTERSLIVSEPSDWFDDIRGVLFESNYGEFEGREEDEVEIAIVEATAISHDACDGGLFDVYDAKSQAHYELYDHLFDDNVVKEEFSEIVGGLFFETHIHFDSLRVPEEFRGNGFGLLLMKRLIETFRRGATIITLKAWPLDEEAPSLESKDCLAKYYARLGFRSVGEHFMVLTVYPEE